MTKWQTPCIHFIGEKERERGRIHTLLSSIESRLQNTAMVHEGGEFLPKAILAVVASTRSKG